MREKIYPMLFGGDINVYSVARAFHEEYGIKSTCYGKFASGPAYRSAIIDYRVCAENEDPEAFKKNVTEFAAEHSDGVVFVIGCGDSYVRLAAGAGEWLPENCIAPYSSADLISRITDKAEFYKLCGEYDIDFPETVVYSREMGDSFDLPFDGPYICKPADSVMYWEHPFPAD